MAKYIQMTIFDIMPIGHEHLWISNSEVESQVQVNEDHPWDEDDMDWWEDESRESSTTLVEDAFERGCDLYEKAQNGTATPEELKSLKIYFNALVNTF
mgnify:CR=1 FL=1